MFILLSIINFRFSDSDKRASHASLSSPTSEEAPRLQLVAGCDSWRRKHHRAYGIAQTLYERHPLLNVTAGMFPTLLCVCVCVFVRARLSPHFELHFTWQEEGWRKSRCTFCGLTGTEQRICKMEGLACLLFLSISNWSRLSWTHCDTLAISVAHLINQMTVGTTSLKVILS